MSKDCRVCHEMIEQRLPEYEPTDICDPCAQAELEELRKLLESAGNALRAYWFEHRNLKAKSIADEILKRLKK